MEDDDFRDGPYLFVLGECYRCRRLFTFSPTRVPSLEINGHREPFCLRCVHEANIIRVQNGLEPIVPLPGAYEPDPL